MTTVSDPRSGSSECGSFSIDVSNYNRDVVVSVAGRFTDDYYVSIQDVAGKPSTLSVKHKFSPTGDSAVDVAGLIDNALIEQQLRFNLNQRFGHLRDQIVEKAFAPIKRASP